MIKPTPAVGSKIVIIEEDTTNKYRNYEVHQGVIKKRIDHDNFVVEYELHIYNGWMHPATTQTITTDVNITNVLQFEWGGILISNPRMKSKFKKMFRLP